MIVKDVMAVDVVTISPENSLAELIEKLQKHNYHVLPVVDDNHHVVGVVNFQDIMKIFIPHHPSLGKLLKSTHFYRIEEEDILETDLTEELIIGVTVADLMNPNVVSIEEHMTIADARHSMKIHDVIRMPVTRDKKLVGFITLFDLIVALFRERGIIR